MILACHNINKSFGDHVIVRQGSFLIEERKSRPCRRQRRRQVHHPENDHRRGAARRRRHHPCQGENTDIWPSIRTCFPGGTIYEELKSAREDIFEMERRIRAIELELKSLTGRELEERLETYNRLQSSMPGTATPVKARSSAY